MKEFTIGKNEAGQRLDRWLLKTLPLLPAPLAQKYIRLKRVKCNGKGAKPDTKLIQGDILSLYINDEFFDKPNPENAFLSVFRPDVTPLYEDENLLLVTKRAGLVVHPDETERVNTLITHIQAYLYQKKEWSPYKEAQFAPALCNRIDRNTEGIVIAAKNAEALRILNEKLRSRSVEKYYLCIVHGRPKQQQGSLRHFLRKEDKQVSVHSTPVPDGRSAHTDYLVLESRGQLSLLLCRIHTGRTHQIRAQLAHAGHPLLGDGKYGRESANRAYGRSHQALCSYALGFLPTDEEHLLSYLEGQRFTLPAVGFVEEFFPQCSLPTLADVPI